MESWIDVIIIFIVLLNLLMLASSRIVSCIRIVAIQGVLVAILPIITDFDIFPLATVISSGVSIALKGIAFPWLFIRAQREANIRKEVEPLGGYPLSMLAGVVLILVSYWLSTKLPITQPLFSSLVVPVSFATLLTGALIIVSRMKAITQILGYLMLENGINLFGTALFVKQALVVELAILLDIFVAVFVMGIAIFHINNEFYHIETHKLSELKDWLGPKKEQ